MKILKLLTGYLIFWRRSQAPPLVRLGKLLREFRQYGYNLNVDLVRCELGPEVRIDLRFFLPKDADVSAFIKDAFYD